MIYGQFVSRSILELRDALRAKRYALAVGLARVLKTDAALGIVAACDAAGRARAMALIDRRPLAIRSAIRLSYSAAKWGPQRKGAVSVLGNSLQNGVKPTAHFSQPGFHPCELPAMTSSKLHARSPGDQSATYGRAGTPVFAPQDWRTIRSVCSTMRRLRGPAFPDILSSRSCAPRLPKVSAG